jgi:cytochrome c oxidase assembly protein subunit 15
MELPPTNRWLTRYAWLTVGATFLLIWLGGLVTSRGAGLAVPDWPNTYGYNLFLFPISHWVGGIFYEHTHRLWAALVGLLTAVLAGWLWVRETGGQARWTGLGVMALAVGLLGVRAMPVYVGLAGLAFPVMGWGLWRFAQQPTGLRWLGVTALAAVILQGVLGGLRVAWLKDELGVFHGLLAQSFLVLLTVTAVLSSAWWRRGVPDANDVRTLRLPFLVATALVFGQLTLGATMRHRHAGLAVPDFPLAYGRVWPRVDEESVRRYNQQRIEVVAAHPITATDVVLHMAHRFGACLVVGAVGWALVRARRRLALGHPVRRLAAGWLGLIGVQFALGAVTVWTNKAADIATAHVAVGALALLIGGVLCLVTWNVAWTRRDLELPTEVRRAGEVTAPPVRPDTRGTAVPANARAKLPERTASV